MGWFDKFLGAARSAAAKEVGKYAAKKAIDKAKGSVESIGEDFLQFAEGELEAAEEARGTREEVVERVKAQAEAERQARKRARADREQRARDELAALKAAYARDQESD